LLEHEAEPNLPLVPSENAELVRRGYEAWNRGDVEGVLALLDPEIEWRGYTHIPESGSLAGRDQVQAWLERFLEAWEELEIELTDLIDAGDRVVALVRFRALGRGSGAQVEGGVDAHVWTVRDGNIAAVKLYQGTREALEAVGLRRQNRGSSG
jgi:ketosteroid isomerase-like protein